MEKAINCLEGSIFKKIESESKKYYEKNEPGHDWNHILRVISLCKKMMKVLGANERVLIPAAFLHDIVCLPKNDPKSSSSSSLASLRSIEVLGSCGFSEIEMINISNAIEDHSYSRGRIPRSLEGKILQDADRLDALGAIGVLRCASVAANMGSSFYNREDFWAESRPYNDKKFMIDHYETKLFKLPQLMNTDWARKEALKRIEFMKLFRSQLVNELDHCVVTSQL
ncbi:MAG: hypothetical protein CME68_08055 [Halobacteriovoraceae bacterium]|nr:hypothetical protein [Halobacteriovoraceae bacterium]|tara:strand:+ start:2786 stop:3463 length:678 start_codon:yes stop_codon:yes gene_type:complete